MVIQLYTFYRFYSVNIPLHSFSVISGQHSADRVAYYVPYRSDCQTCCNHTSKYAAHNYVSFMTPFAQFTAKSRNKPLFFPMISPSISSRRYSAIFIQKALIHSQSNLLPDILHPYFLFHNCHLKFVQPVYWNNKYQMLFAN